jgi:hypothetical protein
MWGLVARGLLEFGQIYSSLDTEDNVGTSQRGLDTVE